MGVHVSVVSLHSSSFTGLWSAWPDPQSQGCFFRSIQGRASLFGLYKSEPKHDGLGSSLVASAFTFFLIPQPLPSGFHFLGIPQTLSNSIVASIFFFPPSVPSINEQVTARRAWWRYVATLLSPRLSFEDYAENWFEGTVKLLRICGLGFGC